jgi:hypothetical protein
MNKGELPMRISKKLFFPLMIWICLIIFNVNAVSADEQVCFKLLPQSGLIGEGSVFLQLGFMNYGNEHIALAGIAKKYSYWYNNTEGLVHGNAEIFNGKVECSLTASEMSSDNTRVSNYSYHLRLDTTTLSGTYILTYPGSTLVRVGPVSVVSCSDWY